MKNTRMLAFTTALLLATPAVAASPDARYGPAPGQKGERTEVTNPGWHQSHVSTSTEVVQYLERRGGSPVARRPDVNRVTSYSAYSTHEVTPTYAMSQHPLESFGWEKPAKLGVKYTNLPQNAGKFRQLNAGDRAMTGFWEVGN